MLAFSIKVIVCFNGIKTFYGFLYPLGLDPDVDLRKNWIPDIGPMEKPTSNTWQK